MFKSSFRQSADAAASALQQLIDERIDSALERLAIARTEDIEALNHRVERLPRFERILVATDFSASSEAALKQAVWLARAARAELSLVHVLPDLHVE